MLRHKSARTHSHMVENTFSFNLLDRGRVFAACLDFNAALCVVSLQDGARQDKKRGRGAGRHFCRP